MTPIEEQILNNQIFIMEALASSMTKKHAERWVEYRNLQLAMDATYELKQKEKRGTIDEETAINQE